ncbi:nucleotidyl transferase family protein [Geodermatophilus marinus]|uniref:TonB-dependent receptor n=1 Tax=Geodermatophilus sp. LHW52908 TaxID=2303986 RepID=UPI000E3CECC4|nr:TonB-dependent receptor [Geodermatophilus sp. LHW52908]RFU22930.1 TonB-dependent receptor [Geodermatophilus sp. LHW52908]
MDAGADTLQKALQINLDPRWYGTIAEIGAGQEVARWFFRAGGAAGTVAKTMSAYDMAVSDAIYGKSDRYVSKGRLQAMLDREYQLNLDRLGDDRGDETAFFAFADTVVARSFRGGNECHGWMGVEFQSHPRDEPSQVVLHVRMLDDEAQQQQEALGVVGVNLLHAAFFHHHEPDRLVESLLDRLTTGRVEIDMIELTGIEFRAVDNRLMALKLVQLGLSGAAMFGPDRQVLQPSEVLRKKAILVERGSFRPPTVVNIDMLEAARAAFEQDPAVAGREVLLLTELTMANLRAGGDVVDRKDFLARADLLAACGMTVLISDYLAYHRLAAYLAWRTDGRIGMVMGVPSLVDLFDEATHADLPGGILESFGRLFKNDLRLFVYPMLRDGEVVTVDTVEVRDELRPLYDYLYRRGSFVGLADYKPDYLPILSRDVLRRIAADDDSWESMVPAEVCEVIKKRGFFGHQRVR